MEIGKISRRDFLKLSGAAAATVAATQVVPFLEQKSPSTYVPQGASSEFNLPEPEIEKISKSAEKFNTLEAILVVLRDPGQDHAQKDYLMKRYNLNQAAIDKLLDTDISKVSVRNIGTILTASQLKGVDLTYKLGLGYTEPENPDDLGGLADHIAEHQSVDEWVDAVKENDLQKFIFIQGDQGEQALQSLGIDTDNSDFQEALLPKNLRAQLDPGNPGFEYVKDGVNDMAIVISAGGQEKVYQFFPEIKPKAAKMAEFIFNRVANISGDNRAGLDPRNNKNFIVFQSAVYNLYLDGLTGNANTDESKFFKETIFDAGDTWSGQSVKTVERINVLVQYLEKAGFDEPSARFIVGQAASGDIESFNTIVEKCDPGVLTVFNSKSARSIGTNSYQAILLDASDSNDGLTGQSLIRSVDKFSGNLFLVPVADRVKSEALKLDIGKQRPLSKAELANSLLNGDSSIESFTDEMFGIRKTIIASQEGLPVGTVISERITEPTHDVPVNMLKILAATEGRTWKSGKEYLIKFIGRNVVASISNRPNSGGSDPTMQLMKMIAPSQYDYGMFGGDVEPGKVIFHRPDLYGLGYLNKLYAAVRDEKAVTEIYDFSSGGIDTKDIKTNTVGQICAKLENYLLARDFRNKFGEEKLMELYGQYVPLGNTREGLQIHGFSAASKYYFDKELEDLNDGEAAILVGLIQAPSKYSPNQIVDGDWALNPTLAIERAQTVARLASEKAGLNKDSMDLEIANARFNLNTPKTWLSTNIKGLAPGTFMQPSIRLGNGLAVLFEPPKNKSFQRFPEIMEFSAPLSPEQAEYDAWFNGIVDKEQLHLVTREKSEVGGVISGLWDVLANSPGSGNYSETALQVTRWCYENGINIQSDPGLLYHINSLSQASPDHPWQCGMAALLVNDVIRIKFGTGKLPFLGVSGGVKNWVRELADKPEVNLGSHTIKQIDDVLSSGEDATKAFEVGDMIISWRSMDNEYEPGHVCTVKDKGTDSEGKTYLVIVDSNYDQMGGIREQVVWGESMQSLVYPGSRKHSALVRTNTKLSHGRQINYKDEVFGQEILFATVDGQRVTIPGMKQEVMDGDGGWNKVVNPGIAIVVFDKNGLVAGVDKTRLLEGSPVTAGNAIKPFVYAFFRSQGIIEGGNEAVSFHPRNDIALDGSDTLVMNPATLMMNLDTTGKVTYKQALAGGFDVPMQQKFKELMDKDPEIWNKFVSFLGKFGIQPVDINGRILEKPTPLAATGRDLYVGNLDSLGFGLSVLANPDEYFNDQDRDLVDILKETTDILNNDEIRKRIEIRGWNPQDDEIGVNLFSPTLSNAITATEFNGHRVVINSTILGPEAVAFALVPEQDLVSGIINYKVVVTRVRGGDEGIRNSPNLSRQYMRGKGAGTLGFPAITVDAATRK